MLKGNTGKEEDDINCKINNDAFPPTGNVFTINRIPVCYIGLPQQM